MKKYVLIVMALILIISTTMILPIHGEGEIYDSVIRLHVLADNDGEEAQALKLHVRDAVLAAAKPLLAGVKTKAEAEAIIKRSLPTLREAALAALRERGSTDPVTLTLTKEHYPTKTYEALAFPAGEYLSLRVKIGKAAGQNWWCVLFPPLCLSAATEKSEAEAAFLAAGLSEEQYRIITDTDKPKYKLRFKILEMAGALFS